MKPGQEILINGEWLRIKSIDVSRENIPDERVYNLTIKDTSTYIANGIVVHNKDDGCMCLHPLTRISTPSGDRYVMDLKQGQDIMTLDGQGKKVAMPIRQISSTDAPYDHKVVHLMLQDGRELFVSP